MRTLYSPDIVSVEGDGAATTGRMPVIEKSERWVALNTIHGATARGPFFNGRTNDGGGQFTVYFTLDATPKATGKRATLEEVDGRPNRWPSLPVEAREPYEWFDRCWSRARNTARRSQDQTATGFLLDTFQRISGGMLTIQ